MPAAFIWPIKGKGGGEEVNGGIGRQLAIVFQVLGGVKLIPEERENERFKAETVSLSLSLCLIGETILGFTQSHLPG